MILCSIEDAVRDLYQTFYNKEYVVAFGIGEGKIYAYLKQKYSLPLEYYGFPIESKIVGEITPAYQKEN